jgi:hypothetical protein
MAIDGGRIEAKAMANEANSKRWRAGESKQMAIDGDRWRQMATDSDTTTIASDVEHVDAKKI